MALNRLQASTAVMLGALIVAMKEAKYTDSDIVTLVNSSLQMYDSKVNSSDFTEKL